MAPPKGVDHLTDRVAALTLPHRKPPRLGYFGETFRDAPGAPKDYESRLERMWPKYKLKKLNLYVLEPHDLALTKLERNSDVDRQDVLDLAAAGFLNPKTLRARYAKEFRPNLVSGEKKHDQTLDLWIEMCWPSSR